MGTMIRGWWLVINLKRSLRETQVRVEFTTRPLNHPALAIHPPGGLYIGGVLSMDYQSTCARKTELPATTVSTTRPPSCWITGAHHHAQPIFILSLLTLNHPPIHPLTNPPTMHYIACLSHRANTYYLIIFMQCATIIFFFHAFDCTLLLLTFNLLNTRLK